MSTVQHEPTDEQRTRFNDITVIGAVSPNEFAGLDDQLTPQERAHAVVGIEDDHGKHLLLITNQRLISYSSAAVVKLGEQNKYTDIKIDEINDIKVQEHKAFDRLTVTTRRTEQSYMVPEHTGIQIAGEIRDLQNHLDTAEQIENLTDQHSRGNISDAEYKRKKRELLSSSTETD